jgi:lipid-A-disaccharide synthase
VVVYKAGALEYLIASNVVKVDYISLVNLIAGKEVVKELIQTKATAISVGEELQALLFEGDYRKEMLDQYELLYQLLDTGSASENTAQLIMEYMNR